MEANGVTRKQTRWLEVGSLANVATLIAIIAGAVGINDRLNALESHAATNCRSINAAIIITLEASRETARRRDNEAALDRTIDRFVEIQKTC